MVHPGPGEAARVHGGHAAAAALRRGALGRGRGHRRDEGRRAGAAPVARALGAVRAGVRQGAVWAWRSTSRLLGFGMTPGDGQSSLSVLSYIFSVL